MTVLRVGTRGSRLARVQTERIVRALRERRPELEVEIRVIRTAGDRRTDRPLHELGDKGLFIKELEEALLAGTIDIAVHSLKDLPSVLPAGLVLAAVAEREDPRDVLVGTRAFGLDALPEGATVATGSLRRRAQLLRRRPDLRIVDVRGNVPTRLAKLDASSWDGLVLAGAGLVRLGEERRIAAWLDPADVLPAVGQGALAVEARADDEETLALVRTLDDPPTALAVAAERAFLARLEGGCQVPLGALGRVEGDRLRIEGFVGTVDGMRAVREAAEGPAREAAALGARLAEAILAAGAGAILDELRAATRGGAGGGGAG